MNKTILPCLAVTLLVVGAITTLGSQQPARAVTNMNGRLLATAQPTITPTQTVTPNSPEQVIVNEDDDFAPGLLIGVLLFFALVLVILGVGIAIAAVIIGGLAFLTLMGIISSSVLIGFIQQKPGSALSAFLTQVCAAIGAFCGIIAGWAVLFLTEWPLDFWLVTGAGAASGLLGGAMVGLPASLGLRWMYSRVTAKIKARRDRNAADKPGQGTS
ncbi:MAG: hypothetical protein JXB07_10130 [Anaerolineae bacterium]|nr:hypothetical protein [Anaerolineae bacterium]